MATQLVLDSIEGGASAGKRPAALPVTRDLGPATTLSLVVALGMGLASIAGLAFRTAVYPTEALRLAFAPSDAFNLAAGLPLLLVSVALARRGRLAGLLCWPGALFYIAYLYIPYAISLPLGVVSVTAGVLVVLSGAALVLLVARVDGEEVRRRLGGRVPARTSAAILIGLAVLIIGRQSGMVIGALTGRTAVERVEVATWIADFALAAPALLGVGIQLWRRRPLGYVTGAGLLLGYGALALGLIPIFVAQARQTGAPLDVAGIVVVLVMVGICGVPLVSHLRAAAHSQAG